MSTLKHVLKSLQSVLMRFAPSLRQCLQNLVQYFKLAYAFSV